MKKIRIKEKQRHSFKGRKRDYGRNLRVSRKSITPGAPFLIPNTLKDSTVSLIFLTHRSN